VVAVLAALTVAGCGSDDGDDGAGATTSAPADGATDPVALADLDGRTFTSTAVTGHDLVADTEVRLSFDGSSLSVNAGCNTTNGEVAVDDDGTLAWSGEPFATMMACDPAELMDQDAWITALIADGVMAALDGPNLTLTAGEVTIEFAEEADAELQGTAWTLDTTIRNEAASSLPAGVDPPTLEIAEDGSATVFAGCNTGGTTVTVGPDTLTFEPMRLTMMACEGDAAAVEAAVVAVLDGEVAYEIDGNRLTLTKGSDGLSYQAP
jgi:heat shock protein HslJ